MKTELYLKVNYDSSLKDLVKKTKTVIGNCMTILTTVVLIHDLKSYRQQSI